MATQSAKVYQELKLRPGGADDRIALESFLPYKLSVIASRVSRGVARLLQFGRIRRDADPRDRRRSKLYLSDEGREVYDEIVPVAHAYQEKLTADLDSNEVRVLEGLLAKIESGVAAIGNEGFGLASGMYTVHDSRNTGNSGH